MVFGRVIIWFHKGIVETFLGLLLLMNRKQEELEQNEVLVAQDKLTGQFGIGVCEQVC